MGGEGGKGVGEVVVGGVGRSGVLGRGGGRGCGDKAVH